MGVEITNAYSMEFRNVQCHTLCMPLWIPVAGPGRKGLYHHPVSGVQIDSVEADGVLIEARDHDWDYDDFDLGTFEAPDRWHCYQVVMRATDDEKAFRLISVSRMEEDDFDLKEHLIPAKTTRIVIRYRPRYPLDELGDPIVAFAERNQLSP